MRMPERLRAASSPMFDMVVATTRSPVSSPRAFRSRAAISRMASPLMTLFRGPASMQRSASPSKLKPRSAPRALTSPATKAGCSAPHPSLMFRPSGAMLQQRHLAAQPPEQLRRHRRRGSIGAVGYDAQAGQREARNAIDEELNVVGLQGEVVLDRGQAVGIGRLGMPEA